VAKRYYICDVIGTGDETNPFRPAVADYNVSWTGSIPVDMVTGQPLYTWAFVLVATDDHTVLRSDKRIDTMPDFPLDGRMNAINSAASKALENALSRRGISLTWNSTEGYREVLQAIGKRLGPNFDIDKFDVTE
jgi:hypothetical protein